MVMAVDIALGSFKQWQHAIAIACISLLALFLYNLYKARMKFVKLRRQGLVRSY